MVTRLESSNMELQNNKVLQKQGSNDYLIPTSAQKQDLHPTPIGADDDVKYDETTLPKDDTTPVSPVSGNSDTQLVSPQSNGYEGIYSELDEEGYSKPADLPARESNKYEDLPADKPPVSQRVSRRPFVEYSNKHNSLKILQNKTSKINFKLIAIIVAFVLVLCVGGGILIWKVLNLSKELELCRSMCKSTAESNTASSVYSSGSGGMVSVSEMTTAAPLSTRYSTDQSIVTSDQHLTQELTTTETEATSQVSLYETSPRLTMPSASPTGVAVDGISGDIYVIEFNPEWICRYSDQGVLYSCFNGGGSLIKPHGITMTTNSDGDARLLVTDEHHVTMFNRTGSLIFRTGSTAPSDARGSYDIPKAITTDNRGSVYVCDYRNNRIQVVNLVGFVQHIENIAIDGGLPSGIAINKQNGDIYVIVDMKVHVYDSSWNYKTYLDLPGQTMSAVSVATDNQGNIIISDSRCECIRIFNKDHEHIQKFGKAGSCPECFSYPSSLAVNSVTQELIVGDYNNERVLVFLQALQP